MRLFIFTLFSALICPSFALAAEVEQQPAAITVTSVVDEALPRYQPLEAGVNGELLIQCSRLTEPLLRRWAKQFQAIYPQAKIAIEPTDSSLAFAGGGGYSNYSAQLFEANSLVLNGEERGLKFVSPLMIGLDRIEIIVHPTNPLLRLSVDQIGWIYTNRGRRMGIQDEAEGAFLDHPRIDDWSKLDFPLQAEPASPKIQVYRQKSYSDASEFLELQTVGFAWHSLGSVGYGPRFMRSDSRETANAAEMVRRVQNDPAGLGYVSHSQLNAAVRAVPVVGKSTGMAPPSNNRAGTLAAFKLPPLVRPLTLWVEPNVEGASRTKLQTEFLKFVFSRQGQTDVSQLGFFPLPAKLAQSQLQAAIPTAK